MDERRALGVIRISVGGENQTGPETQKDRITKRAAAEEAVIVGFAEDIDVSASISPWMRPDLGDWLNNRADEFDVIIILKIDRIARSARHLLDLMDWCEKHGKGLISCEEGFDLSKPWGKMVAKILAVVAEAELDAIKSRIQASRDAMRKLGRWPGGLVPFGRRAVKGEDGFTLELDPEYGPYLVEMIRKFVTAERPTFASLADWLNEEGVPTTQDIARMRAAAGESTTRLAEAKPRGRKWTSTAVQAILTSHSLKGEYQRADGTVVRNDDGTPVMRSVPVLADQEFAQLQDKVQGVKYKKQKGSTSPLVGVVYCGKCQNPLYYMKENLERSQSGRYRCHGNKSKGESACPKSTVKSAELHELLDEFMVWTIGSLNVMESITRIDDKRAVKIAVIDGKMAQLTKELQEGRLAASAYASMVTALAAEREQITTAEGPKPVTEWVSTGQTYADWWKSSTQDERREFLQKHGVRVWFLREPARFIIISFGDLMDNLKAQGLKPKEPRRRLFTVMQEALLMEPEAYVQELSKPDAEQDPRVLPTNFVMMLDGRKHWETETLDTGAIAPRSSAQDAAPQHEAPALA